MIIDKQLIRFSSYLLCLIPLSLLTGPFLPDLILSVISIIFLFYVITHKQWKYFLSKFFFLFIIFYLYLILLSLSSRYPMLSLESSLFYFRFGIFSLAVWFLLDNNFKLLKIFTIIFLLTFCYALFDGYFQYFFNKSTFGFVSLSPSRMTLPINDNMILGGYISRIFPLLFGLMIFIFPKSKLTIFGTCSLLILSDVLIFITGERTALGLLIISTILIVLLISKFKIIRIITFLLSFVVMIFLTINDTDIKERNITKTLNQMNLDQDSENNEIILFSTVHESMFESAYLMFKDNKLFGKGPKLFRIYCDDERYNINDDTCNTHPHNTYVQLAAETGIIGLIFIALIFVSQLSALIKHMYIKIFYKEKSFSDINLCLIICFVISLWPFFPTQNFFNNWINVIYFLPVGFYLYINNNFNGVQEQESD